MNAKTQRKREEFVAAGGQDHLCLFRRDADGGYLATCPELLPIMVYGETLDEACANVAEEIEGWIDAREVVDLYPARDRDDIRLLTSRQTPYTGSSGDFRPKTTDPTSS